MHIERPLLSKQAAELKCTAYNGKNSADAICTGTNPTEAQHNPVNSSRQPKISPKQTAANYRRQQQPSSCCSSAANSAGAALPHHLDRAAQYNTWLFIVMTPKGVVFDFLLHHVTVAAVPETSLSTRPPASLMRLHSPGLSGL